ncbi:hypothetical protein GGP41_009024 [Bipolaris sorokiniana]|uniref:Uncharacterized protein n=1 Tax=Cochliobolus sativus TaxID=45130 RepID=A0A8H5ZEL7_COCSA|nr:hypothetical protein GGP41_009024 [Bipolaris sorokiniana]
MRGECLRLPDGERATQEIGRIALPHRPWLGLGTYERITRRLRPLPCSSKTTTPPQRRLLKALLACLLCHYPHHHHPPFPRPAVQSTAILSGPFLAHLHPPPPLVLCLCPLPDAHVCATTKLSPSANRTQSHITGPARPRCTYKAQHRPSWPPSRPCIPATLVVDPDAFPAWRATSLLRIAYLLWLERSDQHHHHHRHHHYHSPALQPHSHSTQSSLPHDPRTAPQLTQLLRSYHHILLVFFFFPTTTTTLIFFVFTAATTLYTPSSHTSHCVLRCASHNTSVGAPKLSTTTLLVLTPEP